jgi:hypothetical protein
MFIHFVSVVILYACLSLWPPIAPPCLNNGLSNVNDPRLCALSVAVGNHREIKKSKGIIVICVLSCFSQLFYMLEMHLWFISSLETTIIWPSLHQQSQQVTLFLWIIHFFYLPIWYRRYHLYLFPSQNFLSQINIWAHCFHIIYKISENWGMWVSNEFVLLLVDYMSLLMLVFDVFENEYWYIHKWRFNIANFKFFRALICPISTKTSKVDKFCAL